MLRTEALQPIPLYDAHSPPRGLDGWSGYLIKLGGVCELCVGSSVFPIVLRELGTRHASPPRFNPVESAICNRRLYWSPLGGTIRAVRAADIVKSALPGQLPGRARRSWQ
jgi:hypothetical protein